MLHYCAILVELSQRFAYLWLMAGKTLRLARGIAGPLPRHRNIPLEPAVAVQIADFVLEHDADPDAVDPLEQLAAASTVGSDESGRHDPVVEYAIWNRFFWRDLSKELLKYEMNSGRLDGGRDGKRSPRA